MPINPLYFNNAFSKQPLREVAVAMQPFLHDEFENPLTESDGAETARKVLDSARTAIASLLGAHADEIYFVSSGTEANNWALKGLAWNQKKKHLIISAIEHFSVYQTAQYLQSRGFELTIVPVDSEGRVNPLDVARAIRSSTFLVSIQSASDEIGVIQDLAAISDLKRKFSDVYFHTDAVQYLCYEEMNLAQMPFDLVSLNANALYGPAGIGALYIRTNTRIVPMLHGGMQEEGMRPGLQSIALIAGFRAAAEINQLNKHEWRAKIAEQQTYLWNEFDRIGVQVIGSRKHRTIDNTIVILDVDGEAMLSLLLERGIRASSGSTCYQYAQKESHVLSGLNISPEHARGSILFTLHKDLAREDLSEFADYFEKMLSHLRSLKP